MNPINYASRRLAAASAALADRFEYWWVFALNRCSHLSHREKARCWRRSTAGTRCAGHQHHCRPYMGAHR